MPQRVRTQAVLDGCLSIDDAAGVVRRAHAVRLAFVDERGAERSVALRGFWAAVAQHELDHLDGVLFTDKLVSPRWSDAQLARLSLADLRALPGLHDLDPTPPSSACWDDDPATTRHSSPP